MGVAFVGFDPGSRGGMAVISDGKAKAIICDYENYASVLMSLDPTCTFVTIENVHAMPKQGVSSTFSFGEGFGKIQGILIALGFKYSKVEPRIWKKHFGLSRDKEESIRKAHEIFGEVNLLPTSRSKKESDGMAEALLIAKYGMDKMWKSIPYQ